MSNIKFVHLVNGMSILGQVETNEATNEVLIKKPCRVIQVPQGPNQVATALVPVNPFGPDKQDDLVVDGRHIVFMDKPKNDIRKGYDQEYGSGLALPPEEKKLIL